MIDVVPILWGSTCQQPARQRRNSDRPARQQPSHPSQPPHHFRSGRVPGGFSQRQTPLTLIYIYIYISKWGVSPQGIFRPWVRSDRGPADFQDYLCIGARTFVYVCLLRLACFLLMFLFVFRVLDTHPGTRVAPKDESMNNKNCVWGVPRTTRVSKI